MNETMDQPILNEEAWQNHIRTAQNFMGTDAEYCRRNGLNRKTFYTYKEKYGHIRKRRRRGPAAFIKIEQESPGSAPVVTKSDANGPRRPTPDPHWVASFLSSFLNANLK